MITTNTASPATVVDTGIAQKILRFVEESNHFHEDDYLHCLPTGPRILRMMRKSKHVDDARVESELEVLVKAGRLRALGGVWGPVCYLYIDRLTLKLARSRVLQQIQAAYSAVYHRPFPLKQDVIYFEEDFVIGHVSFREFSKLLEIYKGIEKLAHQLSEAPWELSESYIQKVETKLRLDRARREARSAEKPPETRPPRSTARRATDSPDWWEFRKRKGGLSWTDALEKFGPVFTIRLLLRSHEYAVTRHFLQRGLISVSAYGEVIARSMRKIEDNHDVPAVQAETFQSLKRYIAESLAGYARY